jgi:hypothetical protein
MAQRPSATLVHQRVGHYWRGAIRTDRDTVVWECEHEHKERGADRLDYYGRSFGAMLCSGQELRRRIAQEAPADAHE